MSNFSMYILLILSLVSSGLSFSNVKIEPDSEFHEKDKNLIVICNATSILKKPILVYEYQHVNYTLDKINNSNIYVYIGNLTIKNPEQFKVNILCKNSEDNNFISSKIYFFGYSPSRVLVGNSKPILTCQDFNFQRMICCFKPIEHELAIKMGIVEEHDGNLSISLLNMELNSHVSEVKHNSSCFNITQMAFTTRVNFSLRISNILGYGVFNFAFNRSEILKPETPDVYLKPNGNTSLRIVIKLHDDGEFILNYTCSSNIHPIIQTNETIVFQKDNFIILDGWKPHSVISCFVQARIMLGSKGQGNFSEIAIGRTRMPEGIPNSGPFLSPELVYYSSTKANYLEDVVVYFPDLALTEQNGKIIKYQWKCNDCLFKYKDVSNNVQEVSGNVQNIKLNKARLSSSISISACTLVGCSWSYLTFQILKESSPQNRVFLINNSENKKEMNVIWYSNKSLKRTLVYCYISENDLEVSDNECKSIQIIDLDSHLVGRKSIQIEDSSKAKFAFIPTLNGTEFSKIQWNYCISKDVPISEASTKLRELRSDDFIKFEEKCNWYICAIDVTINLPTCKDLPVLVISGILIDYSLLGGARKNSSEFFLPNTSSVSQLANFSLSSNYQINISIIDYNNNIIFWIAKEHITNWWTLTKLGLIIVTIPVALILSVVLCVLMLRRYRKRFFEEKFVQNKNLVNNVSRRNSFKTIKMNNVEINVCTNDGAYDYSDSSILLLATPERTCSTNVTNSSSLSNESSTDQSNDSISYVLRPDEQETSGQENPDCNELPAVYMNLAIREPKESQKKINPFRFNEENICV